MTSFRTLRRTQYAAMLDEFRNDFNATAPGKSKIIDTYRTRPPSFNPPLLYVGTFREPRTDTVLGPSTRQGRDDIVLVQGLYDNFETADRQDVLVDAFCTWVNQHPHAVSGNTALWWDSTEDVELVLKDGAPPYFGTIVTVICDSAEPRNPT